MMTGRISYPSTYAIGIALVLIVTVAVTTPSRAAGTTDIYKPDGTRHCDKSPGISLHDMAAELTRHGVRVYAQRKSYDGREGIAVCNNVTGSINVYEIANSDLPRALQLGFQRLDPSRPAPQ